MGLGGRLGKKAGAMTQQCGFRFQGVLGDRWKDNLQLGVIATMEDDPEKMDNGFLDHEEGVIYRHSLFLGFHRAIQRGCPPMVEGNLIKSTGQVFKRDVDVMIRGVGVVEHES